MTWRKKIPRAAKLGGIFGLLRVFETTGSIGGQAVASCCSPLDRGIIILGGVII